MLLDSTNVSAVELESLTFSEPANHIIISDNNLSWIMRFWNLSHYMQAVKALMSLHKCAVSSEPLLLAYPKLVHR